MRVDQLLKKLLLIKSRSIAKKACDYGLVKINGKVCKASSNVNENDTIEFELYSIKTLVKITKIPKGNVSKKNATDYYEIIYRKKID